MPTQLKKPRKWVFTPAAIAPEWQWIFRTAELATPMWGPGPVFEDFGINHLRFAHGGTDTAVWQGTTRGLAATFDNPDSLAIDDFYDPTPGFVPNYGGGAFTALALVDVVFGSLASAYAHCLASGEVFSASSNFVFGIRDHSTTASNRRLVIYSQSSGGNLDGAESAAISPLIVDGVPVVICARWTSGVAPNFFVDGIQLGANLSGSGNTIFGAGSDVLRIAAPVDPTSVSRGWPNPWRIHGAYLFPSALTNKQIFELSNNFFGPFRMADPVGDGLITPVVVVAAADNIWSILWRRRRR